MTVSKAALAALCVCVAAPLAAQGFNASPVKVADAWARETAPGQTVGGAYLTLTNTGKQADRLLSITSPAAGEVQLHTMSMDGGVMRMRQITGGLPIAPGSVVALKPGGNHIMFIGLKTPFKRGAVIPAELRFERAGRVKVSFKVQPVGAQGMEGAHHGKH